jgi:hypothetical protein
MAIPVSNTRETINAMILLLIFMRRTPLFGSVAKGESAGTTEIALASEVWQRLCQNIVLQ